MRSWSAMARLLVSEARKLADSGLFRDRLFRPLDRFEEDPASVGGITPLADADPFLGFEVLIVSKEMLDLLKHDRWQVLPLANVGVIREGRIDGHADQLLVAAMLVLEVEDAVRPGADDASGNERRAGDHQRVERVAVRRERMRDESVVRRIAHRRVKDPVYEQ